MRRAGLTPPVPVAEGSAEAELLATIISDASAAAESAELPSADTSEIPSVSPEEIPGVRPEVQSAAPADHPAAKQAPALDSAAQVASPIPEFTIEVTPDSIVPLTAPTPIGPARIDVLPQLCSLRRSRRIGTPLEQRIGAHRRSVGHLSKARCGTRALFKARIKPRLNESRFR